MKRNSVISQKQATVTPTPPTQYDQIFLGADLHKLRIVQTRIIDNGSPQATQPLEWDDWFAYVQKQLSLAKKVYVAYEAGAFGFWPCRKLRGLGVECFVVHPRKLDPLHKRVQTDRRDSRELADNLVRYVRGNDKAMTPVYVPTLQEEQQRLQARHRRTLKKQLQRSRARGRGLLLSQGLAAPSAWWTERAWEKIKPALCPQLQAALEDDRFFISETAKRLKTVEKQLRAAAPPQLPLGLGQLTFVLLTRELCSFARFKNRRGVGSFSGLCGGVSASGPYHLDLSINKMGNPEIRALVIELAWRMIYYQPHYKGVETWAKLCAGGHARRRKIAVVALARQLLVDLWRWQTGLVSPQQLGWTMRNPS